MFRQAYRIHSNGMVSAVTVEYKIDRFQSIGGSFFLEKEIAFTFDECIEKRERMLQETIFKLEDRIKKYKAKKERKPILPF